MPHGLLIELMNNVTGSFAAQVACGGADADSMSEVLQGRFIVPFSCSPVVWLLLGAALMPIA